MSKLNDLLQELCPKGVEYKKIGDVASSKKIRNKNHITENAYSITQRGLIPTSEYFGEKTKITSQDTSGYYIVEKDWFVYSPSRIDVGSINFLRDNGPVIVSPLDVVFSVDLNVIRPEYLLNVLKSNDGMFQILSRRQGIEGTGRKTLPFSEFAKINIPVPPLVVQDEVISILNQFLDLVNELTAELTARQKQYGYYREKLLTFDIHGAIGDIDWRTLGDISSIKSGRNKERLTEGSYPVFGSTGIIARTNTSIYRHQQILIARVGANAGYVQLADGEYDVSDNTLIVDIDPKQNLKYLYYYLQNAKLNRFAKGGGQPLITAGQLKDLSVPVPSSEVQERLVHVLDNFDAICSDLNIGLPAEIEARKNNMNFIEISY